MTEKLELLAPAKTADIAKAAILAGADGIFIGAPAFGARAAAGNGLDDLKDLCAFASRFGVKVHVTLNTLFHDDELPEVQELILKLAEIGVGALIVQDLSVFNMHIPSGIELHASTQCDLSSVAKLKFYESLGVSQAVLPRELTLQDIRRYHEACPALVLEAFVSGALCVGQSGICYISELLKNRSANRGRCAQICRLPMTLKHEGKIIAAGHLLSLKDNYQGNNLEAMVQAGIRSFKIEGRLKDKAYVVNQTADLRLKLDKLIQKSNGAYARSSFGSSKIAFTPDIGKTFNRGFTDRLLFGDNLNLSDPNTPKFQGPKVAAVKRVSFIGRHTELALKTMPGVTINSGDGLDYFSNDARLHGFRANSVRQEGNETIVLVQGKIRPQVGCTLRRNQDLKFERLLNHPDSLSRSVNYELTFTVMKNEGLIQLNVRDECGRSAEQAVPFKFDKDAAVIKEAKLRQVLGKRLDEQCNLSSLKIVGDLDLLTVPVSKINSLRKSVLQECFSKKPEVTPRALKNPRPAAEWTEAGIDPRLILNKSAKVLLDKAGAFRQKRNPLDIKSVMTCKFCLVNQYGTCSKQGGSVTDYVLEISGSSFKIFCDCKQCKMHLLT